MKTSRVLAILLGMALALTVIEVIMLRTDPARRQSAPSAAQENPADAQDTPDTDSSDAGVPDAAGTLLTDYSDTREIALINVENANGSYLVMNGSDGYMIRSYEDTLIDQASADQLFQATAHIRADRIITEQPSDEQLEAFGLLSPACGLLYMDLEKKGFSLLIGNAIPDMDARYGMMEGTQTVYAIPSSFTDRLELPVSEYLDLHVLPEFYAGDTAFEDSNSFSASDITTLTLSASGKTIFSLERYRVSQYGGSAFYALTSPFRLYPDWEELKQLLFDPLCSLEGEKLAAELPGEPGWIMDLELPDTSIRIRFCQAGDHSFIVQRDDSELIYEVSSDALSFLSLDTNELLGGTLLRETAASIETIQASSSRRTVEYTVRVSGSDWEASRDGEAIPNPDFLEIVNTLNHIYLQEEAAPDMAEGDAIMTENAIEGATENTAEGLTDSLPEGDVPAFAALSIHYQEASGKDPLLLEFYEADARTTIVTVNGVPAFTVLKSTVNSLMEKLLG